MQFPVCTASQSSTSGSPSVKKKDALPFQSRSSLPARVRAEIHQTDEKLSEASGCPPDAALSPPADGVPVWTVPKSPSGELLKNGGVTPLRSAEASPALSKRSVCCGAEVSPTRSAASCPLVSAVFLRRGCHGSGPNLRFFSSIDLIVD